MISATGLTLLLRRYESVQEALNEQLTANLRVARDIQQATFPAHCPQVGDIDCAGTSQPADETGGDTYDIIKLPGEDGVPRLVSVAGEVEPGSRVS